MTNININDTVKIVNNGLIGRIVSTNSNDSYAVEIKQLGIYKTKIFKENELVKI